MKDSFTVSQKIYDDYQNNVVVIKNNNIIRALKITLFSVFVVSLTVLLFFSERTIFAAGKNRIIPSLVHFFNFQSYSSQQLNTVILFRFSVLGFVFLYSIYKNFINISFNKIYIKKYIVWFFAYLALTITSVLMMFLYFEKYPNKLLNLLFLLAVTFLINLGYSIQTFLLKRKSEPLVYKNRVILIITMTSQGILLLTICALAILWVKSAKYSNFLFEYNKFWNLVSQLFSVRKFTNLLIIIFAAIFAGLLIFGINYERINILINKDNAKIYLKNYIVLTFSLILIALFWFIRTLFYKVSNGNYLGVKSDKQYLYLLLIPMAILIAIGYFVLIFSKKIKTRGILKQNIYLTVTQSLLWLALAFCSINANDNTVIMINLMAITLISIIIFAFYNLKNKNNTILSYIYMWIKLATIATAILVFAANRLLISQKNYLFYTINSAINIHNIMLLLSFTISITFLAINLIKTIYVILKIKNISLLEKVNKNTIIGEKYEEN
ncbi:MSC_0624 family F1-like ATPase-associated membrane protein [Metamycoplasma equirhinis]|uniref:MSC_0624 family F1-like ATPase-associated membrane protein n=1 Tax=Metamycoplasma equirhinis TaxID=92402 RepID=UPI00359C1F1D